MKKKLSRKTIFISSTYEDMAPYRELLWEELAKYNVDIKGMERFGARHESPIETCLTEVAESDIFIGIIGMKMGSIIENKKKSFTQAEYEQAVTTEKEIRIFIISNQSKVRPIDVETDPEKLEILNSFKESLLKKHTVETFTSPEDLSEKVLYSIKKLIQKRSSVKEKNPNKSLKSKDLVQKFSLLPSLYDDKTIEVTVKFNKEFFAASKDICEAFYLPYGATIITSVEIISPVEAKGIFNQMLATRETAEELLLTQKDSTYIVQASMRFSEKLIKESRAHFLDETRLNSMSSMIYGSSNSIITIEKNATAILLIKGIKKM